VKILVIFLLFVTVWVVVICAFTYLTHRRTNALAGARQQCCRKGQPCSAACAREAQEERDRLEIAYDQVARELGTIVMAGRELGAAPHQPRPPAS
jgi:hypothetical protein